MTHADELITELQEAGECILHSERVRIILNAALVAAEERGRVAVLSESGVLATYEDQVSDSAPGLRKWWSGGTWLYPGDKIIEVRTAAESAARGEGKQ